MKDRRVNHLPVSVAHSPFNEYAARFHYACHQLIQNLIRHALLIPNDSCELHLTICIQDSAKWIESNELDGAKKDYSHSPQPLLGRHLTKSHNIPKSPHYGICGPTLSYFMSFLTIKTQSCSRRSHFWHLWHPESVHHGSVLGPLSFIVYIKDLPAQVKSKVHLFANDCLLYQKINNTKTKWLCYRTAYRIYRL